jgi:hypothetical protein
LRGGNITRSRANAWRAVVALASLGLMAWGFAAYVYFDATGANAESSDQFRDIDTIFMVPKDGDWAYVKIEFFMHDDGTGNFASAVDAARADMLARFPGAIEVPAGSVSAAFVTSGFKWASGHANWAYNGTGAPAGISGTALGAISAAAATWGAQGANFSFLGGGATGAGTGACGGGTDGANTVGWAIQAGAVLGVTCSWFGGSAGGGMAAASEFDMQLDPEWNWTTGPAIQIDLQSVATHEFGHALGLNHSAQSSAVMYASYPSGTDKRTPTADDIAGITAIYGASGGAPTNTPTNTPSGATNTPTPTKTPTNTPTPANSATPTNTPAPGSTATPTNTPGSGGGGGASPTAGLPTSTPTAAGTATPSSTVSATNTPASTPTTAGTATKTPVPGAPPAPPSLPLLPGANLLTWPGAEAAPSQVFGSLAGVRMIYAYDPASGRWLRYSSLLPDFANTLKTMKQGQVYWFLASAATQVPYTP